MYLNHSFYSPLFKTFLVILYLFLSINSYSQEREQGEKKYPFKEVAIDSVLVTYSDPIVKVYSLNKKSLNKLRDYLSLLSKDVLVKGKRLHGGKTICNVTLFTSENNYLVNIKGHDEEGITASFFKSNKKDNFKYFMGRLYNANLLLDLCIR